MTDPTGGPAPATGPGPVGYSIVLPPGWLRVAVRHGDPDAELSAVLDAAFADLPRDSAGPLRKELDRKVRALVDRARTVDALDVYAPLLGVRGRAVPASLVVTDVLTRSAPGHAPLAAGVLAALLDEAERDGHEASIVTLPAGAALRVRRTIAGGDDADGLQVVRIDHHLPVPDGAGRWVVATATLPAGVEPLTSVLVDLVDAVMSTWRWRDALVVL